MFRKETGKKMTENSDTETNNSHSTEKVDSMEGIDVLFTFSEVNYIKF